MTGWVLVPLLGALTCAPGEEGSRSPAARASDDETGRLVVVGGALDEDNADVYRAVLEARQGDGPFCVLPTASGVPDESMASAVAAFTRHGADTVDGVWLTTENPGAASDPEIEARLRACSGFWFVGGVQSRVVAVFRPDGRDTPAYRAVMDRYRAGAVVAGSSAGAAMMPQRMIAGGSSEAALGAGAVFVDDHGGVPEGAEEPDGVIVEPGMGFEDGPVFDQHFLARGRIGRLVVATLAGVGGGVGYGVDENTALVVDGDRGRVVGASGVVLVDARGAEPSMSGHGGAGVRIELLGRGDAIDMATLEVTPGAGKRAVAPAGDADSGGDAGDGETADPSADPFARWAFLRLLDSAAGAAASEIELVAHGYRFTLRRGADFRALNDEGAGVVGARGGFSTGPWWMSVLPDDTAGGR